MLKTILVGCLFVIATLLPALNVDPARSGIVVNNPKSSVQRLAAVELQKHLKLITGIEIPIGPRSGDRFHFLIGFRPEGTKAPSKPEEARWFVTRDGVYFDGDDRQPYVVRPENDLSMVSGKLTRSGSLFAVYDFLENVLGVHWVIPGDAGIVFRESAMLELPERSGSWTPQLIQRQIRSGYSWRHYSSSLAKSTPDAFKISEADYRELEDENNLWLKRMRMGRSLVLNYGHAFVDWWKDYGTTHPEYFALTAKGKREPLNANQPDRIKLCVSNPAVHQQIVDNWLKFRENPRNKEMAATINVCENDSAGFCLCENCLALDGRKPGEGLGPSVTNRYVYLADRVTELARRHDPEIYSVMYAYAAYRFPPTLQKVDPRVIIGAVPFMLSPRAENEAFYRDWRDAGAEKIFLRPNDQHLNTGLPMGLEKAMFDAFKLGIDNGVIGTDYDSLQNFWPVCGIGDYILAKAHIEPERSFEYWENEYCSAYGAAADDVKAYFAYWRQAICETKLSSAMPKILKELNGNNVFRTGVFRNNLHDYYTPADFDRTDAILAAGIPKKLLPREKALLDQLVLANRHARLTHQALIGTRAKDYRPARELLQFRVANRDKLDMNWPGLFRIENTYQDITGVQKAASEQ